jgi:hypothetical protein
MRHGVHHRPTEAINSTPAAWILALVALSYGLFLWIISVFTIVHYEFSSLREFWSTPNSFGLSNFQIAVLVNLLFAVLVVLSATTQWRASESRPWSLMVTYGASLAIVIVWSINLYGMATLPINDSWYYEAISDEPYDQHRLYLGQVIATRPCADCSDGVVVLAVRLETNEDVEVTASASRNPVGSIVAVRELRGRFTATRRQAYYLAV